MHEIGSVWTVRRGATPRMIAWTAGAALLAALAAAASALDRETLEGTLLWSGLTAAATAGGAAVLLALRHPGGFLPQALLGAASVAMLAAAGLGLLPAAVDFTGSHGLALVAAAGGAAFAAALMAAVRMPAGGGGAPALWFTALVIAVHNLPEGFAVGAAAAGGSPAATSMAIAAHNVAEGLLVAAALWSSGARRWTSIGLGAASGLAEPLAAVFGAAFAQGSEAATAGALAAAAGAMLWVVVRETLPAALAGPGRPAGVAGMAAGVTFTAALAAA